MTTVMLEATDRPYLFMVTPSSGISPSSEGGSALPLLAALLGMHGRWRGIVLPEGPFLLGLTLASVPILPHLPLFPVITILGMPCCMMFHAMMFLAMWGAPPVIIGMIIILRRLCLVKALGNGPTAQPRTVHWFLHVSFILRAIREIGRAHCVLVSMPMLRMVRLILAPIIRRLSGPGYPRASMNAAPLALTPRRSGARTRLAALSRAPLRLRPLCTRPGTSC